MEDDLSFELGLTDSSQTPRNFFECKIKFEIDDTYVCAHAIDFKEEYPIEEDLCNITLEDLGNFEYEIDTWYTADFKITWTKSWTDCGYEYDAYYEITNIKEIDA